MTDLRADPAVDQLVRNLTLSNKKWTDIVGDILEMGRTTGAAEAEAFVLSECQKLLQVSEIKDNSEGKSSLLDIGERMRSLNEYISQQTTQIHQPTKTFLMNWFLEQLLIQQDVPFKDYSANKFIANLLDDTYISQRSKIDVGEVESLIKSGHRENSLTANLVILYTLMMLYTEGIKIEESKSSVLAELSKCHMLSKDQVESALQILATVDKMKIFECGPRMIVISGYSSDCTKFEVRGEVVASAMGLCFNHNSRISYFEVTFQGKRSSVKGIRIGWADKLISTSKELLGSEPVSWVLDLSTGKFFHQDPEAIAVALLWDDKSSNVTCVESESIENDMFGDLFGQEEEQLENADISRTTGTSESDQNILDWNKVHTVGCLLDNSSGVIYFYADGIFSGVKSSIDLLSNPLERLAPIVSSNGLTTCDTNLGQKPFKYLSMVVNDFQNREQGSSIEISDFLSLKQNFYISFTVGMNSFNSSVPLINMKNVVREACKSLTFEISLKLDGLQQIPSATAEQNPREFILFACSQTESMTEGSLDQGCSIGVDSQGRIFLELHESARIKSEPNIIKFGDWSHVSVSYTYHRSNGTADVVFYLNGQIVVQSELTGSRSFKLSKLFPKYAWIGMHKTSAGNNNKSTSASLLCESVEFCNIRLWSSSRSNDRVTALMQRDKLIGIESELLSFLPCNEGIGQEIHDVSRGKCAEKILKVNSSFQWKSFNRGSDSSVQSMLASTQSFVHNFSHQGMHQYFQQVLVEESNFLVRLICSLLLQSVYFIGKFGDISEVASPMMFEQWSFRSWISPTVLNLELLVSILKFLEQKLYHSKSLHKWVTYSADILTQILGLNIYFSLNAPPTLVVDQSMIIENSLRVDIFRVLVHIMKFHEHEIRPDTWNAVFIVAKNIRFFINSVSALQNFLGFLLFLELSDNLDAQGLEEDLVKFFCEFTIQVGEEKRCFDALSSLKSIPSGIRRLLVDQLCCEMAKISYWEDIKAANDFRSLQTRDSMLSTLAQNKPVSINCRMRRGCLVKRGPDWRYGDEDGGEGSVGIVLDICDWISEPGCGITVVWNNAFIEKYRWNCQKPNREEKYFDLSVVELDDSDRAKDVDAICKVQLKYNPQFVDHCILKSSSSADLSKSDVLQYMLEIGQNSWVKSKLHGDDVETLSTKHNEIEVCQLYKEFYDMFGIETGSLEHQFLWKQSCSAINLTQMLLLLISKNNAIDGPKDLLKSLQYICLGSYELFGSPTSNKKNLKVQLVYDKESFAKEFGDIYGKFFTWNWSQCSWVMTRETAAKSEATTPTPREPMLIHAKIIARFSFENCNVPESIQIRTRSRSCDITMMGNREWETIVADMPLKPNTGVYIWYIKIRNIDKRSRFIFGISKQNHISDGLIGHDGHSWGLTQNFEYVHNGKKISLADEDHRLINGSILEVSFDTSNGNLRFLELTENNVFQMNMSEVNIENEAKELYGKTLFPAFSFFAPGDSISLITEPDEIKTLRGKFTKSSSFISAGRATVGAVGAPIVKLFPGSPPVHVVEYVLANIRTFNAILQKQSTNESLDRELVLISVHSLAMLCKWTAPPMVLQDDLKMELLKLLQNMTILGERISAQCEGFEIGEYVNHLSVVTISASIRICSNWIRSDRFLCTNEVFTRFSSVGSSLAQIKQTTSQFLSGELVSAGFRKTASPIDGWIADLRTSSTNFATTLSRIGEQLHIRALQKQLTRISKESSCNDLPHHAVFMVFVYHLGLLSTLLLSVDAAVNSKDPPLPPIFVSCWEASQQVVSTVMDTDDEQIVVDIALANLMERVEFVSKLEPMMKDVGVLLLGHDEMYGQTYRLSSMEKCIKTLKTSLLMNFDVKALELMCRRSQEAARKRCDGFKMIKAITDILCSSLYQDCKTIFFDRMSMILKGLYCNWIRTDFSQGITEMKRKENTWYYTDGLKGISPDMKNDLKGSFGLMLETLVSELNSAELTGGNYQLALLSTLALRLESCDHETLSRVNFFLSIHELLEHLMQSLTSIDKPQTITNPSTGTGRIGQLLVVAMKLFVFAGMQIATFGQDEGNFVRSITSEFATSPELQKVKSGPGTLNKAVFEILFDILTSLRTIAGIKDTAALVSDCIGLLFCVSKHPECQKILSKPKWISSIVDIIDSDTDDSIVQKLLLTLSDILMIVRPEDFKAPIEDKDALETQQSSSIPARNLIKKLLTLAGSKFLGLKASFNKKGLGRCNFGVLDECISLIRKLLITTGWSAIIKSMVTEIVHSTDQNSPKLIMLGVLLVLGGSLHTLYPSCPVSVNLNGGIGVGVVKSFSETSDTIDIACCKLLSNETGNSLGFQFGLPAQISVPSHSVCPLNWESKQLSVELYDVLNQVILLAHKMWGNYNYSPTDSGVEGTSKDFVQEKLFQILLLKSMISFMTKQTFEKKLIQDLWTSNIFLELIQMISEESKKSANVGGVIETSLHEQYLVSLIAFSNSDVKNSSSDKESQSSKFEDKDEDSSPMVETLVNMGFPRQLCVLALQICGGDPAEALNYILSNGSSLLELLKKSEARENGSSSSAIAFGASDGSKDQKKGQPYHYDKYQSVLHPYYSGPSIEAERIGAVFPGEKISVVEELDIDGKVWFRVPLSEFNNPTFQNNYGEEIKSIFVWIPKVNDDLVEVVLPGGGEGNTDFVPQLSNPPIAPLFINRSYRVIGTNGALVRSSPTISSEEITTLSPGTIVHAVEESMNREGTMRLRITKPVVGWISKIPGLLERIPDISEPRSPTSMSSSSQMRPELVLLFQLEDNFECITGAEVFAKEDRFFGNLQGAENLFLGNQSRFQQAWLSKKQRVCGAKSFGSIFSVNYSPEKFRKNFETSVHNLRSLLGRNFLVIVGMKYLLFDRTIQFGKSTCDNHELSVVELSNRITPALLLRLIRCVAFREDPYSTTGLEVLGMSLLERLACSEEHMVLEEQVTKTVSLLLKAASPEFRIEFQTHLVDAIAKNLRDACDSKFQDLSWVDATYEEDMDKDINNQPNLHFSLWGTNILLDNSESVGIVLQILQVWMLSLRGTSMTLKYFTFRIISIILKHLREHHPDATTEAFQILRSIIPVDRLMSCASRRIWMEMEDVPSFSRFLQAFINFLFEIYLVSGDSPVIPSKMISGATKKAGEFHRIKSIFFTQTSSHVKLLPQKDLPGSWTLEVWLFRQKGEENQHTPYVAKKSSITGSKRNGGGTSTEKKSSLSSLLQLLLGRDVDSSAGPVSSSTNPGDDGSCWCVDPSFLMSSSKFHIKLQKGGRIYSREVSDPIQETDRVEDEAFCFAMGQSGNDEKVFDCTIPCDKWVHLAIVCDSQQSLTSVFLDGKFIDSQQFTMQFPICMLGSNKSGHSFCGGIQDLKLWSYARSQQEISRNMRKQIPLPTVELLVHMSCDGSSGELIYDRKSYIVACKPIDCVLEEAEDLFQNDSESTGKVEDFVGNRLFDSSSQNSFELTGYVSIPSFGQKPPLANGIREIIVVNFSMGNRQIGTSEGGSTEILGYVNWSERNVKLLLVGSLKLQDGKFQLDFTAKGNDVLFGSPEKLAWLQLLSYSGPFSDGMLSGACLFTVKLETVPLFEPGSLRIDLGKLPAEIAPSETDKKCKVTAREGTPFGQYLVFYHVYPYKEENDSDGPPTTWRGMTEGKGSIWVDFLINHNCGDIAFGWSTSDALVHPDASVDANEGTWTYSTAGSSSHGGDLFLSDVAEDGDTVSLHLNSETGLVRFYKNNIVVVEFRDLLAHKAMGNESNGNGGVRPFVNLICDGDSVTLLGSKEGYVEISFAEDDSEQRKKLFGHVSQGSIQGEAILQTVDDETSGCFGVWENDHQTGHHIHIEDLHTLEPHILKVWRYDWDAEDKLLKHEEVMLDIETLRDLASQFKNYRSAQQNKGGSLFSQRSAGGPLIPPITNTTDDMLKLNIQGQETVARNHYILALQTAPLLKAVESYAAFHDCPIGSFRFYLGNTETLLDLTKTPLDYGLANNAVIVAKPVCYTIPDTSAEDPVEEYFNDSVARYVVQVVYESGATVRDGIEIEECAALRTLHFSETVEAFQKGWTSEGIGRYRIPDGWISEKLRGNTNIAVTRLLREKFGPDYDCPLPKFKIIRDGGIKLRAKASIKSRDLGQIPTDTIVTVSERRQIYAAEEKSWVNRLWIESPEEYRGWISEKSHLVGEIKLDGLSSQNPENDPALAIELKRRTKVRQIRQARKAQELTQRKHYKSMTLVGEVNASAETLFLLKKSKYSENSVKFSPDFTSIKCSDSGGRSLVLGSRGFSHGVHYWEVEVKSANWGSIFIGVAPEEASGWNGFGFINYRATQAFGNESIYGTYFGVNDKVGVLLDMDHGTISFFKDGEDFNMGKVTVVNMGVAYHNLRKTTARYSSSQVLYPCFGMKSGDELSIKQSHWISTPGFDSQQRLSRLMKSLYIMHEWEYSLKTQQGLVFTEQNGDSIIDQLHQEYLNKCNPEELFTDSRPGLPIAISISNEDFTFAVGKEFVAQHKLQVGVELSTVYGNAVLIGTSTSRSRIWYSCERNGKKAWYWLVSEFKSLITGGKLNVVGLTSSSFLSTTSPEQLQRMSSLLMSREEFSHWLLDSVWTTKEEHRLVEAINQLSAHIDKDPSQLNIEAVRDYLVKKEICQPYDDKKYLVRYVALCLLNKAVSLALPLIDLSLAETRKTLTTTTLLKFDKNHCTLTLQSSTRNLLLGLKRSIFTSTKMSFWQLAIQETTAPTAAPADEYERPEEIREIPINRIQARNAIKKKDSLTFGERLKLSVFGQLMEHISGWDERSLRRSYVHMQDAGQSRGFFVKFVGEGVDDQGGPYRAVFETTIGEEISDLLGLVIPCPNAIGEVGENRDKFIFNNAIDLTNHSNIFVHLGRMVGLGARHKILLPLSLVPLLWKSLAGEPLCSEDLQSVDMTFFNSIRWIVQDSELNVEYKEELLMQALTDSVKICGLHHKVHHQIVVELVKKAVSNMNECMEEFDLNCENVVQLVEYFRLMNQNAMLQHFFKGLSAVVPVEILSMFTPSEVETVFCGESELDLEVLKKVTIYEAVSPTESHIQYFWDALEKLDRVERSQFVNFCSGRSRLPTSASEFSMPFKLTAPHSSSENDPDKYLPIARTCFFSLSIPKYSNAEICLAKLRYAINNTELMDADFIDRRGTSAWDSIN